jgi:Bacteriophage replication protein O
MSTPLSPTFTGFQSPHYTMVPDELFDELLTTLSGAELKVLLYIIRRTFGFKQDADAISLAQMLSGITTKDGRILDRGIGLSKPTLLAALRSLIGQNIIEIQRRRSVAHGDEPTVYKLKFRTPAPSAAPDTTSTLTPENEDPSPRGKKTLPPPVVKKLYHPVVKKVDHTRNSNTKYRISNIRKGKPEQIDDEAVYAETTIVLEDTAPRQEPFDGGARSDTTTTPSHQEDEQVYAENTIAWENTPSPHPDERARQTATNSITAPQTTASAGFTPVGGMLGRHRRPLPSPGSTQRDALLARIEQFATEFDDKASLKSSTSRAYNLLKQSGVSPEQFLNCLWEARAITRERITHPPRASQPIKAKMGYFFSVLAERVGVQDVSIGAADVPLKHARLAA